METGVEFQVIVCGETLLDFQGGKPCTISVFCVGRHRWIFRVLFEC